MLKYIKSRKLSEKGLYGIVLCVITFFIGEFILNKISTMEDPPFGNTIYILIGNLFVFGALVGVLLILKYIYDENNRKKRKERKRKSHKIYFLNKEQKGDESTKNNL